MGRLLATGIGLIMLAGLGPSVWAEQGTTDSKVTMDEVVVTATKTAEKRRDISNSMVVKDSVDIQEAPANNLGQLLANEAGIDWRTYGDYGGAAQTFMIRGMESDEALVMVNGVPLNSPSLGEADVGQILLNNIERVEVIKGSGSLLYGSGAMAGTVNVITKEPSRGSTDLTAKAGYGSQNTYQLSAENGMFLTDNLGYYLTVNRLETDGHRDNGELVHNDASLKLLYDRGQTLKIGLYGQIIDRQSGVPGVRPPEGTGDYFLPATGEQYYSSESASLKNSNETLNGNALLEIESQPLTWLSYRIAGSYIDTVSDNDTWYNATGLGLRSKVTNRVLGAEGHVEVRPLENATVLVGADFDDHDWDSNSTDLNADGTPSGADTTNSAKIYQLGTFGEAQYRPCRYVKLHYGLRQQHHSTFGTEYLPRFGAILNPWASTAIKYNRGKHFKAPTPNDLFWPESDFARGNPDLKPQTGWHSDVTVEQEIAGDKWFLAATYFEWNIKDKIGWSPNPAYPGPWGDKWTPTNLNRSKAYGWEAGIQYNPTHRLTIGADVTYTDAEEEIGQVKRRAQYVPRRQYKVSATYRFDFGLTAGGSLRYVGKRYYYSSNSTVEPDEVLGGYTTVDMKLEQRLFDHWLVSLEGRNLFDKDYDTRIGRFTDSAGGSTDSPYPGAGRSVYAAVAYEY